MYQRLEPGLSRHFWNCDLNRVPFRTICEFVNTISLTLDFFDSTMPRVAARLPPGPYCLPPNPALELVIGKRKIGEIERMLGSYQLRVSVIRFEHGRIVTSSQEGSDEDPDGVCFNARARGVGCV